MRIIVCGSRTYNLREQLEHEMNLIIEWEKPKELTIVTGAATGADTLAYNWANRHNYRTEQHPANWNKHGKAAGPIRNQKMLDLGADLVVGFLDKPRNESRGTNHMLTIAENANVDVCWLYAENWKPYEKVNKLTQTLLSKKDMIEVGDYIKLSSWDDYYKVTAITEKNYILEYGSAYSKKYRWIKKE